MLVRGVDDRERVPLGTVVEPGCRCRRNRRVEEHAHPVDAFGRERDPTRVASRAGPSPGRGEEAHERILRPAFDARVEMRRVAGHPEELELEREHDRDRARHASPGRGGTSSRASRKRVSAVNAFSFASCSVKRRSIASSPIMPTWSRYGSVRIRSCERTSEAPVTVSSSPRPWWSTSSTWEKGSSRAPKRDLVLRTPFATAPTRPRSCV